MLYAGTSGFSYAAWKGHFYPDHLPAAKMLPFYAERLNGVELNGSFYRLPLERTLDTWAAASPEGFRFCLKAPRGLTYSADAFPKAELAGVAGARLVRLGSRLGPVLVQWPPVRLRDAELLDRLLTALGLAAAVEFRHDSWLCEGVYGVLRRHGAALVRTDEEKWPPAPAIETGPIAYYRLRRDYGPAELARWRRELRAEASARRELHVYFKHEIEAPQRARFMLE